MAFTSGTITANSQTITLLAIIETQVYVSISGTYSEVEIVFEGTVDGSLYIPIGMYAMKYGKFVFASGLLTNENAGFALPQTLVKLTGFRVRSIAFTSGSADISIQSMNPSVIVDPTSTVSVSVSSTSDSITDNTAFVDGTSKVIPAGFILDETAGTSLTENDAAAARVDNKRSQVFVIEDETIRGRRATVTAANAVKVDGSSVTQPVSGTVTSNIGTTNGLALDTSVAAIIVSQGSTTSGEKGPLIQGAVTTSAPSYTTAQTSPLSLTTAGALRVDGSGVTQPVSGTVTANAGTGTMAVSGTVTANAGTGTYTVAGGKTNNNAAPGATNVGALVAIANAAAPSWTEGNEVLLSTDLSGALRVSSVGTSNQVTGNAASGAADSGNPVKIGAVAHTANPTAVTDGQRVDIVADKVGRLVVTNMQVRNLKTNNITSISSTTETTVLAAGGAGVFHDLTQIIITNTSINKDANVDFKDSTAGTTRLTIRANAQSTISINFADMLTQATANNNWTATSDSATAALSITVLAVKNI